MKHMGNKLSSPVDQQISFIETGPGNLNYHIFNHPKKYRTAAFPALGYGLANCPADVVAKAIIDAAIKVNFKKCRSDIKSHLKSCSQVKGRDNEEKIDSWTQQSVLKFYKYCLNHNIWPTINLDQREVKITNEQGETCNIDFKKLKEIFNHRIRPMRRQNLANYSLPVRWQSQSTNCTRFLLDEY
ncbi:unnamed protein product [Rotaria socialis]|uniref:Uncharacterized protein n=1 Tax=Rotaria socialis TaxID=392032 RepID=A0A820LY30_9BILA|nr:unnamed protein product [Rotaria socialis]